MYPDRLDFARANGYLNRALCCFGFMLGHFLFLSLRIKAELLSLLAHLTLICIIGSHSLNVGGYSMTSGSVSLTITVDYSSRYAMGGLKTRPHEGVTTTTIEN